MQQLFSCTWYRYTTHLSRLDLEWVLLNQGKAGETAYVAYIPVPLPLCGRPKGLTWKPDLMEATVQREPHDSHCRKNRRVSFCRIVSGERHV